MHTSETNHADNTFILFKQAEKSVEIERFISSHAKSSLTDCRVFLTIYAYMTSVFSRVPSPLSSTHRKTHRISYTYNAYSTMWNIFHSVTAPQLDSFVCRSHLSLPMREAQQPTS